MDKKLKTAGILGIIGYILSLPILIWKSSNLGKIVFLAGLSFLILHFSTKFIDKGLQYYKSYRAFEYNIGEQKKAEKKYSEIQKSFSELNADLERSRMDLADFEAAIKKRINKSIVLIEEEFKAKLNEEEIDERIKKIESSLDLIQNEERLALKNKIIEIKELVKVHNKSIDSAEIRKVCEQIADHVYLLNEDEKDRMIADLEEIGFKIKKIKDESEVVLNATYDPGFMMVTSDSIYFGPRYYGGGQ